MEYVINRKKATIKALNTTIVRLILIRPSHDLAHRLNCDVSPSVILLLVFSSFSFFIGGHYDPRRGDILRKKEKILTNQLTLFLFIYSFSVFVVVVVVVIYCCLRSVKIIFRIHVYSMQDSFRLVLFHLYIRLICLNCQSNILINFYRYVPTQIRAN